MQQMTTPNGILADTTLNAAEAEALLDGLAAAPPSGNTAALQPLIPGNPDWAALHAYLRRRHEEWRRAIDGGDKSARLQALREALKQQGADAFLIPRGDEHFGEYVPLCAERLAWLTGFTGSAGLAVAGPEQAAIFVDGRYTLQVRAETDATLFEPRHIGDEPPHEWIVEHLAGKVLGYDPMLHAPAAIARLKKHCRKAGVKLRALKENPVDAIWEDRPPPPLGPVIAHPLGYAGRKSTEKCRECARAVAAQGADAAILIAPDSIAWLLNIRGGDVPCTPLALSFAILHADGGVDWFVDERKLTPEARNSLHRQVRRHPPAALAEAVRDLGRQGRTVLIDAHATGIWFPLAVTAAGGNIIEGSDPCQRPKARKNKTERDGARAAHRRDGIAMCRFLHWLDEQVARGNDLDELTVVRVLRDFRARSDLFRDVSFETIAGAGANGAINHYRVSEKSNAPLVPGGLLLLDSGGQYPDGTTDITRTIAIGTVKDEEIRDRFTRVLMGHIDLACLRFPVGTNGGQIDAFARAALWRNGLDYDHGTGHGVGAYLSVHEGPQRISKAGSGAALEPGMILSNEPGYYKAGSYGIRIENLVLVTEPEAGETRDFLAFETLTLAPIDRRLIVPEMLSPAQSGWLNRYHRRVFETLAPDLDEDCRQWLQEATRPL